MRSCSSSGSMLAFAVFFGQRLLAERGDVGGVSACTRDVGEGLIPMDGDGDPEESAREER